VLAVSDARAALAEHLRYFQDLGVVGLSGDPAWSMRPVGRAAALGQAPTPSVEARLPGSSEVTADASVSIAVSLFDATSATPTAGLDPAEALTAIQTDLGDCTRCKLHALGRTQIVFGVGSPTARLMFVGEAPGQDEDRQGIPFVGRAGQLLTRTIERLGLRREDVYIANVIKCRPPANRNPEPDEVATCEPFLFRQIDAIRPKVIVALGTFAAQALLQTRDPISRLRGRVFNWRGARLIPTFHPAFLLRNPPEAQRKEAWSDFKKARALLDEE
jgi:DNA polymerase